MEKTVSTQIAKTQAASLADQMIRILPEQIEHRIALGAIGLVAATMIKLAAGKDLRKRQEMIDRHIATLTALLAQDIFGPKREPMEKTK